MKFEKLNGEWREGRREGGREGGRKGGREGGREGGGMVYSKPDVVGLAHSGGFEA